MATYGVLGELLNEKVAFLPEQTCQALLFTFGLGQTIEKLGDYLQRVKYHRWDSAGTADP